MVKAIARIQRGVSLPIIVAPGRIQDALRRFASC
jgi:hypothetical protein